MKQRARRMFGIRTGVKPIQMQIQRRPERLKYLRLAVFLCFVAGILCANLTDRAQLGGFGIWNGYFIEKFKYARIQPLELFYYVLEERLPVFLLLLLFAATNWGILAGGLFLGWQCFAAGFLMASSVAAYGIKGILLIGTAVFPQYLLYIPIYISYLYLASFWRERARAQILEGKKRQIRDYSLFAVLCICMLSVYIAGIFLESYVNPYLLKNVLKFF